MISPQICNGPVGRTGHSLTALLVTIASLLAVALTLGVPRSASGAERPNILFVFLDDLGWRDVGFMGTDFYETPHLDRWAADAMVFTNAYSTAANCAPSRACLLSGQYTPRHRIFNVGTGPRGKAQHRRLQHIPGVDTLDPKIRTWAHQLKAAGYVTATMGKWHLSDDPLPYGFDVNVGGTHSGGPPRGYYPPHPVPGLRKAPPDEYLTDRLSEEAIRFIEQNQQKPWALYLTHFAVHTPLHAKRELLQKYDDKPKGNLHNHVAMATMIQAVDDGIGRIQRTLERLRLAEKTIVIFTSDNGGYGPATDMAPLKGYKGAYYEGGIRVPMFIRWPGVTKGTRNDTPVSNVDIYPTLCELTGADRPQQPMDGESLVGALQAKTHRLAERPLFWHFPAYLQSYGTVNQEQRDPLFRSRPCSIIRQGDWKLHHYFEDGGLELYNLREDVAESQNLIDSEPERAKQLLATLERWRREVGAPIPTERNPMFDAEAEAEAIARAKGKGKGALGGGKGKAKSKARDRSEKPPRTKQQGSPTRKRGTEVRDRSEKPPRTKQQGNPTCKRGTEARNRPEPSNREARRVSEGQKREAAPNQATGKPDA